MRLGCDVDGVVLDTLPLYEKAFQVLGYPLKLDKAHLWDLAERHGVGDGIINKVLSEIAAITNVSLVPGAQILNKIAKLPHIELPIYFLSGRHYKAHTATQKALDKHFTFPFKLLCVGGILLNKGDACHWYGLDFFVEDGPPHIEDILGASNTNVFVLDQPHNQNIKDGTGVIRVKNWHEILINLHREGKYD